MPPSIKGLLRHFRLNETIRESENFKSHLDVTAQSLLIDEGIEVALERLACIPVKVPNLLIEEFGKLSLHERQDLLQKLSSRWASPVCKLHLIDLALNYTSDNDGNFIIRLIQQTLDELYSKDGEISFQMFKTLLNWVNDGFSHWAEFNNLSSIIRLAVIWSHTSKLHNLLYQTGVKIDEFTQLIVELRNQRQMSAEVFDREPTFWNDVLHPRRLNRMDLVVHGLAVITSDKDSNLLREIGLIDKVKNLAVVVDEQQSSFPNPELWHDPSLAKNSLVSFLGGDRKQYLSSLLEDEIGHCISSEDLQSTVEMAIDTLTINPLSHPHWLLILRIVNDLPIYNELVNQFKSLILSTDFVDLFNKSVSAFLMALEVTSKQVKYIIFQIKQFIRNWKVSLLK